MQKGGFCQDFTETESFKALKEDPDARVVLSCKSSLSLHMLLNANGS